MNWRPGPESSKIISASISLSIQRTDFNPNTWSQIQHESPKKDETENALVSTVKIDSNISALPGKSLHEQKRHSSEDIDSEESISRSQSNSSIDSIKISSSLDKQQSNNIPSWKTSPHETNIASQMPSIKESESVQKEVQLPMLPPPLPLRDWQKSKNTKSLATAGPTPSLTTATSKIESQNEVQKDLPTIPKINVINHNVITKNLSVTAANEDEQDEAQYESKSEYQQATLPQSPRHTDDISVTIIAPGSINASNIYILSIYMHI